MSFVSDCQYIDLLIWWWWWWWLWYCYATPWRIPQCCSMSDRPSTV